MENAEKYGCKVEELKPQVALYPAGVSSRKSRRMLLEKEGDSNVSFQGIERKPLKYLKDIYNTLVDMKWRYVLLLLFGTYLVCYVVFAVIYWLLCYMQGQFQENPPPDFQPCIKNVKSFAHVILFSLETQSTIGFGTVNPRAECPGLTPVLYLHITVGFMIEIFVLGFFFMKIARPKYRRHTLVFSRNACLCLENGHLNFQIRVGDIRRTHLVDTKVHGVLVRKRVMQEKHVYPLFQHSMKFTAHNMGQKVFLIWPIILSHTITEDSPLWELKPQDVLSENFDVIIFLEGTIESTGEPCQARTCYSAREIIWGHRFVRIEEYDEQQTVWCVDFTRFNNVVPSMSPRYSARELHDLRLAQEEQERSEVADEDENVYDNADPTT